MDARQEIADLRATLDVLTRNPLARPPPALAQQQPAAPASLLDGSSSETVHVPRSLLPVLAHLKDHVASLSARNTQLESLLLSPASAADAPGRSPVDLSKVVDRLRTLTDENTELEMVVRTLAEEVGQARGLRVAVQEAHETIKVLDNDLERAYGQVEHLQALLGAYERHFGPLEDENRSVKVGEASMEGVQ